MLFGQFTKLCIKIVSCFSLWKRNTPLEKKMGRHAHQVRQVALDPNLASAYGVKRDSLLNTSKYYHVVEGLASDVMHDVLQGVIPKVTKLILAHLVDEGHFSVDVLNEKIRNFAFGATDSKNKPEPKISQATLRSANTTLKQSGKYILYSHKCKKYFEGVTKKSSKKRCK